MRVARYAGTRAVWRLGFRMLRPRSRLEWVAQASVVVAAMLTVVVACLGIGSVAEIRHQDQAVVARAPLAASSSGPASRVYPVLQNTRSGSLEVIWFANKATGVTPPPGAPWPAEGTAWVSPRLAELLRTGDDPLVSAMVPGTVAGTIDRVALAGPDDLVAYLGVSAETMDRVPESLVRGFGDATATLRDDGTMVRVVTLGGLAAIGLGAVVALSAVAQLAAGVRERRLAACVLIGLRPRTLALVGAVSGSAWAGAGAALGVLALWPVGWLMAARPTFGVSHWSTVALVPWPARAAVAVVTVLLCAVLARANAVRDAWGVRRRAGEHITGSWWRLAPLVGAFLLLAYVLVSSLHLGSTQAHQMSGRATYALLVGAALGVIGLAAAQPVITRALRPLTAEAPLPLRLAVARHTHTSAATRWFTLGLAIGILGLGFSAGMASGMSGRVEGQGGASGTVTVGLPMRSAWAVPSAFDDALARVRQSQSLTWVAATDLSSVLHPDAGGGAPTWPKPRPVTGFERLGDEDEIQAGLGWADASAVAAIAVSGWQSQTDFPTFILLSQNLDQRNRLLMEVLSLGLVLGVGMAAFASGAALVGLQARREDADAALLAVGLSHGRLVAVRAWEACVTALPLALVAMVLACLTAVGLQHVDDATLPIDWGMLAPIVAAPAVMTALTAVAAILATPGADKARVRRD